MRIHDADPIVPELEGPHFKHAITVRCPACGYVWEGSTTDPLELSREVAMLGSAFLITCGQCSLSDVHAKIHGGRL